MNRENIDNVPLLNFKVTVQNCRKSLHSTQRLTPDARNRSLNNFDFRSSIESQRVSDSNQEIPPRARYENSLGTRSGVVSRDRLRTRKKQSSLEDLSDLIDRNNPTNSNILIKASQSNYCLKNQLREQIHGLYGVEKENSKSYEIQKRQALVPYVMNKQEFKRLPPKIINRAGSSYRNLSERDRYERNSIEIYKLRLSIGKDEARDRAICLSVCAI